MKILAVTPVEAEFDALTKALAEWGLQSARQAVGRLSGLAYLDGRLLIARGGLGKAQFGIQTQHLLDHLEGVGLVICAGTAGGLMDALSIGDVVIATDTVEHDFKFGMASKPLPRFEAHAHYLSVTRSLASTIDAPFRVHFGPIASGDEDVVHAGRAQELRRATGAWAVAWEGAGGARAAHFSNTPYLEIRGISDGANEKAPTAFYENIPVAMKSVALVLHRLVQLVEP